MKKIFFLSLLCTLCVFSSRAQVDTYNFSSSTGTYSPLSSEGILWSGVFDDNISSPITIPAFTMNDITYTTMYVSTNGYVTLGTTAVPSSTDYYPISGAVAYDKALAPFGRDLLNASTGIPKVSVNTNYGGEIVVQWQDVRLFGGIYDGTRISFQLHLNPSTGQIRFIYGGTITGVVTAADIQVGLRGGSNTDYNNRTTSTNWVSTARGAGKTATCSFSSSVLPATGLTFTYSACNVIYDLPYKESFDGANFPPSCWANINTAGPGFPGIWDRTTTGTNPTCSPHSGMGMARFNSYLYQAGTTGFLATQQISMFTDQYEVHFWMYRDNGFINTDLVNVYYNTVPHTAGGILLGTVHRYSELSPVVATPNQWYEYVFNVPPGSSGKAFFVFEGVSWFGNNIFIDDVKVKPIFPCPAGAIAELEPCGSETNNGCNMPVPAFESITLGETKCGTVWSNSVHSDNDWYSFTLLHRTEVKVEGYAEFDLSLGILPSECPQGSFISWVGISPYNHIWFKALLEPGTYYLYVAPSYLLDNACGNENKYTVTLTGTSCFVENFPFKESFDQLVNPTCWINQNISGPSTPGTWDYKAVGTYPTCTPHSGSEMASFDSYNYFAGTAGILVTPQLSMLSDQYEVHFWMFRDDGYPTRADRVNVYYSQRQSTAGATLLGTVNRNYLLSPVVVTPNQWYEYIFKMPVGSSGTGYIVFEGISDFGNNIFIDDVKVSAVITCPAFSTAELEPCGLDQNGGCNMTFPAAEPITLGETKCGTAWFDGITRDTDWYTFTLTETTEVTLTAIAEFQVVIGFLATPCPQTSFIEYNTGPGVPAVSVTATLGAGTYYAFIAPQFTTIIGCVEDNKYSLKLEMASPPGSAFEQEPCGADLNGGCNMPVPAFEPMAMGETISGTCWFDGHTRDTDWYIFTLTQKTRVTLTGKSEFPEIIGFTNSPCPQPNFIVQVTGSAGASCSVTTVLDPGSYYAFIADYDLITILPCGGADKYWITLTGSTCFEPVSLNVSSITATTAVISWSPAVPAPVGGYQYEVRTSGVPGSGAAGLAVSGTTGPGVLSRAISGLSPNTTYFLYVGSICGGNSYSPWSASVMFETPYIAVDLNVPVTVVWEGHSDCYNALQTITTGGDPPYFIIVEGGRAALIAGFKIHFLPGILVEPGGYMHAYIVPGGPFCIVPPLVKAVDAEVTRVPPDSEQFISEQAFFRIYPNPTTGRFTLEQKGNDKYGNIGVEIFGMRGEKVFSEKMDNERRHELSLSEIPTGLYFVKVIAGDHAETIKLVKIR